MRAGVRVCVLLFALVIFQPTGLVSQDRDVLLRGEYAVDLMVPPDAAGFSGLPQPGYIPAYPDAEQAEVLLAEASEHFSAMIWGWSFVYTPLDLTRRVDEYFSLKAEGSVVPGNPALRVEAVRLDGSIIYAELSYLPSAAERSALAAWNSARFASAQGQGRIAAFPPGSDSPAERRRQRQLALEQAVKEALRGHYRNITFNKPREIRGRCALSALPRVTLRAGQYLVSVRLRIETAEIIPYGDY